MAIATVALLAGGVALTAAMSALQAWAAGSAGGARRAAHPRVRCALFVGGVASALSLVLLPWLSFLLGEPSLPWLGRALGLPLPPSPPSPPSSYGAAGDTAGDAAGRRAMLLYWAALLPPACLLAARLTPTRAGAPSAGAAAAGASLHAAGSPTAYAAKARLLAARKSFHFLAVALFVPAVQRQPTLLQLCLAAALPSFLLLEVVRVWDVPPLGGPLRAFLGAFLDARDGGTLVLTHAYLLLGCALPVWLMAAQPGVAPSPALQTTTAAASPASLWPLWPFAPSSARDAAPPSPLTALALVAAPHAGSLVLGIGDAMASLVGVHAGRVRWPHSRGKTVEGSAAAAAAMLAALAALVHFDGARSGLTLDAFGPLVPPLAASDEQHTSGAAAAPLPPWVPVVSAVLLACALEASTSQIDNLFLPIFFQALLLAAAAL